MGIYAPRLFLDAEKDDTNVAYRVTGPDGRTVTVDAALFEAFYAPASPDTVAYFRGPLDQPPGSVIDCAAAAR